MVTPQAQPAEPRQHGDIEVAPRFVPTPERLSQYLEINIEDVMAQLKSVEGREQLYSSLVEHEEDLRTLDPSFHPEELKEQLDLVSETLHHKEAFLEDMKNPEKEGVLRRAWEKVKGFSKRHPVVMTLLMLAIAAGGVAGGFYLAGNLEALLSKVGLSHLYGADGAGEASKVLGDIIDGTKQVPNYFDGPTGPTKL